MSERVLRVATGLAIPAEQFVESATGLIGKLLIGIGNNENIENKTPRQTELFVPVVPDVPGPYGGGVPDVPGTVSGPISVTEEAENWTVGPKDRAREGDR